VQFKLAMTRHDLIVSEELEGHVRPRRYYVHAFTVCTDYHDTCS